MTPLRAIIVLSAVLLLLSEIVECQLTFSPDWGKRSGDQLLGKSGTFFEHQTMNCKTSEILTEIIRFVQAQASHYSDCKHRE